MAIKTLVAGAAILGTLIMAAVTDAVTYSANLNTGYPSTRYFATYPSYYYTGFYDYDPYRYSYTTPAYSAAHRSPYYYTFGAPAYSYWSYGPSFSPGYSSDGTFGTYFW
jgi:hypothetical protein